MIVTFSLSITEGMDTVSSVPIYLVIVIVPSSFFLYLNMLVSISLSSALISIPPKQISMDIKQILKIHFILPIQIPPYFPLI